MASMGVSENRENINARRGSKTHGIYSELMTIACGMDLIGVILVIAGLVKYSYFPDAQLLRMLFMGALVFFYAGVSLSAIGREPIRIPNVSEV